EKAMYLSSGDQVGNSSSPGANVKCDGELPATSIIQMSSPLLFLSTMTTARRRPSEDSDGFMYNAGAPSVPKCRPSRPIQLSSFTLGRIRYAKTPASTTEKYEMPVMLPKSTSATVVGSPFSSNRLVSNL